MQGQTPHADTVATVTLPLSNHTGVKASESGSLREIGSKRESGS
jgi:hypothetical protein